MSAAATLPARAPATAPRALLWLAICGSLFYAGYGFANWAASQHGTVASFRFAWEQQVPFLPCSIVPYWSIDLFYALAFFLCVDAAELQLHVRRILTVQLVAVTCFLVFPLQLVVVRPATDGIYGFLFTALGTFDRPYNQMPSLHIALLVVLWDFYARHLPRRLQPAVHGWSLLIGVSVLTTWQHHFVDVPTGAALGLLCLWLWPEGGLRFRFSRNRKRRCMAAVYALGATALACAAIQLGGGQLWLLWPALSLGLVALNYLGFGAAGFRKRADGTMPPAIHLLLAPHILGARLNAWLWGAADRPCMVADGVWIGRFATDPRDFVTIVDLCAELPVRPRQARRVVIPALDLIPLAPDEIRRAVAAIEAARAHGPVLVVCALGYGRSAHAVAAWLLVTGRAETPEAAVARLRARRPRIALDPEVVRC